MSIVKVGRSEVNCFLFPIEEVWSAEVAQHGVQGSDQEGCPGEKTRVTVTVMLTRLTCADQHEPGAGQADDDLAHGSEGPGDAGTEGGIPSLD